VSDPNTYWLNFMNIALGIVVLISFAALIAGIVQELAARRKKRAELAALDHEVADLVAQYDSHTFHVPGLGVTMADGGEPAREKEER